jgi:hypothetical protein
MCFVCMPLYFVISVKRCVKFAAGVASVARQTPLPRLRSELCPLCCGPSGIALAEGSEAERPHAESGTAFFVRNVSVFPTAAVLVHNARIWVQGAPSDARNIRNARQEDLGRINSELSERLELIMAHPRVTPLGLTFS